MDVVSVLSFLRENIHFVLELSMLLLLAYTMRSKPKRASDSAPQLTAAVSGARPRLSPLTFMRLRSNKRFSTVSKDFFRCMFFFF